MNKEDSLYIKKKFGAKILSILKRLAGGGGSGDKAFTVTITGSSSTTLEADKTSQEVINAICEGKVVIYILKGQEASPTFGSIRQTSLIIRDGGTDRLGVIFMDGFMDGGETIFWQAFTHEGSSVTFGFES